MVPTSNAIDESIELAHGIYNREFRNLPSQMKFPEFALNYNIAPQTFQPIVRLIVIPASAKSS